MSEKIKLGTKDEAAQLTAEAIALKKNPLFRRLFRETEKALMSSWASTEPKDAEMREHYWKMLQCLGTLDNVFDAFLASEQFYNENHPVEMNSVVGIN